MAEVLTTLETIDTPPPLDLSPSLFASTPNSSNRITTSSTSLGPNFRRISRLPPAPCVPSGPVAGPSRSRYLYIAVRRGHAVGVFTEWTEAEAHVTNHPDPIFKAFSTRLAAEAFVAGWDGAGRHALPPSSPRPLREHLAMNFPSSVPVSPQTMTRRPSYHERLLATVPSPADEFGVSAPNAFVRPPRCHAASGSFRSSTVRVSSPLRMQVDEEMDPTLLAPPPTPPPRFSRTASSLIGIGGLLSPPPSPEDGRRANVPVIQRQRPTKSRGPTEAGPWSASLHRDFAGRDMPARGIGLGLGVSLPSPPTSPTIRSFPEKRSSRPPASASGLWADSLPPNLSNNSPSPLPSPELDLLDASTKSAPKFSRAGLKKSGVILPVAASRSDSPSNSVGLLSKRLSHSSLFSSPNSSNSSLSSSQSIRTVRHTTQSASSAHSSQDRPWALPRSSQDRLSTLAETSRRELQLNDEGLLALSSLELQPPRAGFMRRTTSSSSLASTSSGQSVTSLTSVSSAVASSLESCEVITEEGGVDAEVEVVISCTKSDGDVDGSVESSSVKSGIGSGGGEGKNKGGLFKRFSKALKLEKKGGLGQEAGRRPSV